MEDFKTFCMERQLTVEQILNFLIYLENEFAINVDFGDREELGELFSEMIT